MKSTVLLFLGPFLAVLNAASPITPRNAQQLDIPRGITINVPIAIYDPQCPAGAFSHPISSPWRF
jgi:hypothetical protein